MLVHGESVAGGVLERVELAAGLGAFAPVAAAPAQRAAEIALPAVGDAQGAVHEEFQLDGSLGPYGLDLLQGEFAGQDDALEAGLFQEQHLLRGGIVRLGAGYERDRRQGGLQQAHVLDDRRVRAGFPEPGDELLGARQLLVAEDGVDRGVDLRAVPVGIGGQFFYIRQGIARGGAGAEMFRAYINRVGAAVDGVDAGGQVFSRREKF